MAKKTIAIIGATSRMGSAIAKIIAKGNYRLLLFSDDRKKLNSLAGEIRITNPSVEIDCMDCAANASWEADIIIPAIPFSVQNEIAKKIQPYANRKIVISISGSLNEPGSDLGITSYEELQKLLPGAKIVKTFDASFRTKSFQPAIDGNQMDKNIATVNEERLEDILEILKIAEIDYT